MSQSIAEQLAALGWVDESVAKQVDASRKTDEEHLARQQTNALVKEMALSDLSALESTPSMREFKSIARKVLEKDPDKIDQIVELAHRFKGEDPANRRFIWFFYQVRNGLATYRDDPFYRQQFLARAFRKANPRPDYLAD